MIGNLWTVEDIAKHCHASYGMVSQVCRRNGIEPIGRACRVRLFMSHQVEQIAAGLASRRPYAGQPRYTVEEMGASPHTSDLSDTSTALPRTGHVSALGVALAAGVSEQEAEDAIKAAHIEADHIDGTTPMYAIADVIAIVKALSK